MNNPETPEITDLPSTVLASTAPVSVPTMGSLGPVAHSLVQPWVICDASLSLVEASENWLFAYGLPQLPAGEDLRQHLPASHARAMLDRIDGVGTCSAGEPLEPLDNELHDLRFLLSTQRLDSPNVTDPARFLFVLREVSVGLALAESRRERHQREALLRALLHDLQSPLSAAQGALDLLGDNALDTSGLEILDLVRMSIERAQQYVRDFGEFTLLSQPQKSRQRRVVDLESFLESIVDVYRLQGLTHPFAVDVARSTLLSLEIHSFTRLLDNLLGNAVKYSPDGGEVRVSARQLTSGEVEISISDHGLGIRPESLNKIWEPFYRANHESGQRQIAGTGLGLAVVKHVAQLHGAKFSATSTVGQGSCFTITLPKECCVGRITPRSIAHE